MENQKNDQKYSDKNQKTDKKSFPNKEEHRRNADQKGAPDQKPSKTTRQS